MQINPCCSPRSGASRPWTDMPAYGSSVPVNLKILIVNEDLRSADALNDMLQELGYLATFRAYSARRALAAAAEFLPAIVIVDLDLPDMTGYQLARMFRTHLQRQVRQATLLAIAEPRESVDPDRARAAGFIGCLTKPVAQLQLHGMLRRLRGQFI